MTAPILVRLGYVAAAVLVTIAVFGGLAGLRAAASRGELHLMPWSVAR